MDCATDIKLSLLLLSVDVADFKWLVLLATCCRLFDLEFFDDYLQIRKELLHFLFGGSFKAQLLAELIVLAALNGKAELFLFLFHLKALESLAFSVSFYL